MIGYGIMLSTVCITLGVIIYFKVKRVMLRVLWTLGVPFIVTSVFYFYVAILSNAPFDKFFTWSVLIIALGTGLGSIMTGLGMLGGYFFSRISS